MARRRRPLHISYSVLVSLLVASIPLFAVGGYVALGIGQAQLRRSFGDRLAEVAERTAAEVDSYMFRRILDAAVLAKVPAIRDAATTGAESSVDTEGARQLDTMWRGGIVPPAPLATFFEQPASRFLTSVTADDPVYLEIMLADSHGVLVAASGATSDYIQSDESWWRDAMGDGVTGRIGVGDIEWDESASAFAVTVSVPVLSPTNDRVDGVVRVVLDSREMFAAMTGRGEGDVRVALVRTNGTVVFSQDRAEPTEGQFFAEELLRQELLAQPDSNSPSRFSFSASEPDGSRRLVAVAESQLGRSYSNLPWLVVISEPEAELFEPVRAQVANLFYALATTALLVLALALWFSWRLTTAATLEETEMHLVAHAKPPQLEEGEA